MITREIRTIKFCHPELRFIKKFYFSSYRARDLSVATIVVLAVNTGSGV